MSPHATSAALVDDVATTTVSTTTDARAIDIGTEDLLRHDHVNGGRDLVKQMPTVLVTGGAGFIGSHTAHALLLRGHRVIVVDELNDYYDINIKLDNLQLLRSVARDLIDADADTNADGDDHSNGYVDIGRVFVFYRGDVADRALMEEIIRDESITAIVHLAARAGVRASIDDPDVYVHSNVLATTVVFDLAQKYRHLVRHVVYASSSSVYGANKKVPFSELDPTENIVSPYAATKKACEAMASAYASMFKIPLTGLRFFTVYGPRGRPDMAPFKFVDRIARGLPIDQYGDGSSSRDYTYIDDIVAGIIAALGRPFHHSNSTTNDGDVATLPALHSVYNLGNSQPVTLLQFIDTIERAVGTSAIVRRLPMQLGDVDRTYADLTKSARELGYKPQVSLDRGMRQLVAWWRSCYECGDSGTCSD